MISWWMTDRQSRMKGSVLGTYLPVKCEGNCQKRSSLTCWLRWNLNVVILCRELAGASRCCKLTSSFTERKMLQEEKSELTFDEIVENDSTKKVAALAFVSRSPHESGRADNQYNCLSTISCSRMVLRYS